MNFQSKKPPSDPEAFLPVADMLRCSAKLTGYTGPPVVSLLRVHGVRNGLPMFQARIEGHSGWTWVARVDLFCAFLSHRRMFTGWRDRNGKVTPPPSLNSPLRKALRHEWVRAATFPSQRTRALSAALSGGGAVVEWRKPP